MLSTEEEKKQVLKSILDKGKDIRFCVLGAGHGGVAMAGHLAIMGYYINIYNRTFSKLEMIDWRGGIKIEGEIEGFGRIQNATSDIKKAIEEVDVLMVVVPASAHRFIAEVCAPYLKDGQIIILNPGRTGGTLEFRKVLADAEVSATVFLAETQTFIYASRNTAPAEAYIFRVKNSVPLATLPAHWIPDVLAILKQAFPQFVPGDSVLRTGMDNIGAVFHPAMTILNAGWIEETHGEFQYYIEGASLSVSLILEEIDKERVAVAAALGIRANTAREWLYLAYDAVGKNLYEAIHDNHGYKGIKAPSNLNHRYIEEDVPMSLVPIASIGEMLKVPTPAINAIIHFASVIHQKDYWKEGRTVDKLGLGGLSVKEIRQLAVGIE